MFNIHIDTKGTGKDQVIVLTVKVTEAGRRSASGKSMVIASTEGNMLVPGTDLTIGLNVYRKA